MFKLLHKLFGWDYIAWENSCDHGVARVRISGDGILYYYRYKTTQVIDLVKTPGSVKVWLTCPSTKYFEDSK